MKEADCKKGWKREIWCCQNKQTENHLVHKHCISVMFQDMKTKTFHEKLFQEHSSLRAVTLVLLLLLLFSSSCTLEQKSLTEDFC